MTCFSPHRKRTMFQNIVNATEPMTDEKEATAFVSNNPIRKEIVMYVNWFNVLRKVCQVDFRKMRRFLRQQATANHQRVARPVFFSLSLWLCVCLTPSGPWWWQVVTCQPSPSPGRYRARWVTFAVLTWPDFKISGEVHKKIKTLTNTGRNKLFVLFCLISVKKFHIYSC